MLEKKVIMTAMLTYLTYLLGGIDVGIKALLTLVLLDYLTGIMKAIVNKQLNSYVGWRGGMKKGGMFIVIMVAVQIEIVINQPGLIRNAVAFAFILNEGISILENLTELGVPVPQFLVKRLQKMKDNIDIEGEENNNEHNSNQF